MLITLTDILWGVVLTIWVAIVTLYISRQISKKTSTYVARKSIHILGGGVVAILAPFLFTSPLIPIIASYVLMIYLVLHRRGGKMLNWFQDKENRGEVYYTFSFGSVLLLSWLLDGNYWDSVYKYVALLPIYYMSFGDGVTGIIRNYVYKRRVKGFWGSVGMLAICSPLGYLLLGIPGLISGIIATLAEVLPIIDDNLSVPFLSFLFLYLTVKFF
ncbi:MAG: phosphatidate cytidylyltransferase [Sulfolobus sp.]